MSPIFLTLTIAVAGLLTGHLATRWWERARPMIVPRSFTTVEKNTDPVDCEEEVSLLTKQSWFMDQIGKGETPYYYFSLSYNSARVFLNRSEGIDTRIREARDTLAKAKTPQEIRTGVLQMVRWTAVSDLIELGFLREVISASPGKDYGGEALMPVVRTNEKDGCYVLVFDTSISRFGTQLDLKPWRERAIAPLINAIRYLDKSFLVEVLDGLPEIAHEQIDVHRRLVELMKPTIEDAQRWVTKFTIVNYGNSPIVVWPDAKLNIKESRSSARYSMPSYLAKEYINDEGTTNANDLDGPLVMPGGESIDMWAITDESVGQAEDGEVVQALYKAGTAKASLSIQLTTRGLPFKYRVKGSSLEFENADVSLNPSQLLSR